MSISKLGLVSIGCYRSDVNTTLVPLCEGVSAAAASGVAEALEIVSSDALDDKDNAAGWAKAARLVFTSSADGSIIEETVQVDGATPVAAASVISNRLLHAEAITFGTGGKTNKGDLTIRLAGGGAARGIIRAGRNRLEPGQFVVPKGYTAEFRTAEFELPGTNLAEILIEAEMSTYTGLRTPDVFQPVAVFSTKASVPETKIGVGLVLPELTMVRVRALAAAATQISGRVVLKLNPVVADS